MNFIIRTQVLDLEERFAVQSALSKINIEFDIDEVEE